MLEAAARADHSIYPDPSQTALREALGRLHNVSPDCIVAGAGCDDVIDILIRLLGPRAIVISTPTFGMYDAPAAGHRAKERKKQKEKKKKGKNMQPGLQNAKK